MLVLFSCQKEAVKKDNSNDLIISKVNNWLDKQKSEKQPNKAANIDLLKENIDFSSLNFEDLNQNEQFIVIPIKENYKLKKNIDVNTPAVLLLVRDKTGSIVRGNIVLYFPENNQQTNTIPGNTFSRMYNEKNLECNGLFRFLSPTGRWLYQREYKNGKLYSSGYVKADNTYQGRTSTDCTYYFFTLSLWVDDVVVAQETIYLGRICDSACDDPNNQSLCPDNGGGGGGGSGSGDGNVDDYCVNTAISEFQQEVNGAQTGSQTESIIVSGIDEITKHKNPTWTILTGAFNTWHLSSRESGVIKLIDAVENRWAWKSLEHGSITLFGSPAPTTSIVYNQGSGTPSFTPEAAEASVVLYAGMKLDFNVTYRLICNCPNVPVLGWFPPISIDYSATSTFWNSNPD